MRRWVGFFRQGLSTPLTRCCHGDNKSRSDSFEGKQKPQSSDEWTTFDNDKNSTFHEQHPYSKRPLVMSSKNQTNETIAKNVATATQNRQSAVDNETLVESLSSLQATEYWRDDSRLFFTCPLCCNVSATNVAAVAHSKSLSLSGLADHMAAFHDDCISQQDSGKSGPSASYPFTESTQRAPQAAYQRHNTLMTARVLRRHFHLASHTEKGAPSQGLRNGPPIVMLLDVANMERNGIDALLSLAPLDPSDAHVLERNGLLMRQETTALEDSAALANDLSLPSLSESLRRHILRVVFGAHPFTFIAMLEDGIVPNCRLMQAVTQIASLHPQSAVEVLWAGTGDEAGDFCASAFLAELRRGERELMLASCYEETDPPTNADPFSRVDPCFTQRRVAKAAAGKISQSSPHFPLSIPIMLLSDDQIQRTAMGQLFGVGQLAYSHSYAITDIVQCLRGLYWRVENEARLVGKDVPLWSEQPWLRDYLCL